MNDFDYYFVLDFLGLWPIMIQLDTDNVIWINVDSCGYCLIYVLNNPSDSMILME